MDSDSFQGICPGNDPGEDAAWEFHEFFSFHISLEEFQKYE